MIPIPLLFEGREVKRDLINFMEQNPQLRSGKFSKTFTFKKGQELWSQITNRLNSLPGAKKDWRQWRKTWADIKVHSKKKNSLIKNYRGTTGGGPALPNEQLLTSEEDRVLNMIGPLVTNGLNVLESSTIFNFEERESDGQVECEIDGFSNNIIVKEHDYFCDKVLIEENENTEVVNKDNIPEPSKNKSGKKLFQVTRLQNTIAATEKMADQNERRMLQKEKYEANKLKLYEKDIAAKNRIATVLEKIFEKMK